MTPDTTKQAAGPRRAAPILVIDDEVGPRESLRILLKTRYDVHCADSVDEGIRLLKEVSPSLIIMDIRMPGKNGIEGLREIRAIDPNVAVVMLTGYGALETAQEAIRLGANDYLKKPFDTDNILEVVQTQVARTDYERRRSRAVEEMQNLNNALVEELASKEQLASIGQASSEFVHDIRNPLTIVVGYVDLLSEQLRSAEQELGPEFREAVDYLDVIEKNVQRCHELSRMWQNHSRGDLNQMEETRVSSLMDELATGVEPLLESCHIRLERDLQAARDTVRAAPAQLLRAIHNIIANAIHAVDQQEDGAIRLRTVEEGDRLAIVIEDNGCGIPEEKRKNIFEAYYTTKEKGKGTGLGLYISKKIIEDHNGDIEIQSEVGRGTGVTIRLPLQDPAA